MDTRPHASSGNCDNIEATKVDVREGVGRSIFEGVWNLATGIYDSRKNSYTHPRCNVIWRKSRISLKNSFVHVAGSFSK